MRRNLELLQRDWEAGSGAADRTAAVVALTISVLALLTDLLGPEQVASDLVSNGLFGITVVALVALLFDMVGSRRRRDSARFLTLLLAETAPAPMPSVGCAASQPTGGLGSHLQAVSLLLVPVLFIIATVERLSRTPSR